MTSKTAATSKPDDVAYIASKKAAHPEMEAQYSKHVTSTPAAPAADTKAPTNKTTESSTSPALTESTCSVMTASPMSSSPSKGESDCSPAASSPPDSSGATPRADTPGGTNSIAEAAQHIKSLSAQFSGATTLSPPPVPIAPKPQRGAVVPVPVHATAATRESFLPPLREEGVRPQWGSNRREVMPTRPSQPQGPVQYLSGQRQQQTYPGPPPAGGSATTQRRRPQPAPYVPTPTASTVAPPPPQVSQPPPPPPPPQVSQPSPPPPPRQVGYSGGWYVPSSEASLPPAPPADPQQQARPRCAGQKHRRVYSGSIHSTIHRRMNSGGAALSIPRVPASSHHRENSAGLDMLSAAADVSKEELAMAAGGSSSPMVVGAVYNNHRRDVSCSSAFGSLGSLDFKRMMNNISPTSHGQQQVSGGQVPQGSAWRRSSPVNVPAPDSNGAPVQGMTYSVNATGAPVNGGATRGSPTSQQQHPLRGDSSPPPTPLITNTTQPQQLAPYQQQPSLPQDSPGDIALQTNHIPVSPTKKKKAHHRYLSSFSANFAEFIGASASEESKGDTDCVSAPNPPQQYHPTSSSTSLLNKLEESIDANAVSFVSQLPPPPPVVPPQSAASGTQPQEGAGELVGQLVFPSAVAPSAAPPLSTEPVLLPRHPAEELVSRRSEVYNMPPQQAAATNASSGCGAQPPPPGSGTSSNSGNAQAATGTKWCQPVTNQAAGTVPPRRDATAPFVTESAPSTNQQMLPVAQAQQQPSAPSANGVKAEASTCKSTTLPTSTREKRSTSPGKGSKRVRRKCTVPGCENRVVQGGRCISHGAKRKTCAHPGCNKNVKKAGLCSTHGPARKRCEFENCGKVAVQGGRCITHGARKKLCCLEGCTKQSIINGMCKKHHDEAAGVPPGTRARPRKTSTQEAKKRVGIDDASLGRRDTTLNREAARENEQPASYHQQQNAQQQSMPISQKQNGQHHTQGHRRGLSIFHDMNAIDSIICDENIVMRQDQGSTSAGETTSNTGEQRPLSLPSGVQQPQVAVAQSNDIRTSSGVIKNVNTASDGGSRVTSNVRRSRHQRGLSLFSDEKVADAIISNNIKLGPIS